MLFNINLNNILINIIDDTMIILFYNNSYFICYTFKKISKNVKSVMWNLLFLIIFFFIDIYFNKFIQYIYGNNNMS